MTKDDLLRYIKSSVDVADPDDGTKKDSLYLKLSDEDLILYLNVARTRLFPNESLDDFPEAYVYPLMIVAKKELYLALALRHARQYDIGADDNNYLKRSQWYKHYMQLAENMDDDLQAYLDNGGAGGFLITSANTYLAQRYRSSYNYEKANLPYIKAKLDKVSENVIEVSWQYKIDRFDCVRVYVSNTPVADTYELSQSQISELSQQVALVKDPHLYRCRISGCSPETQYYVCVTITDWTGRTVFDELAVTTATAEEATPSSGDTVEASL